MMRIIEINLDELDPDLAELLLVSGKVRTEEQLMRKALLDWIDPLIAGGAERAGLGNLNRAISGVSA
jgi:hypothetical protein